MHHALSFPLCVGFSLLAAGVTLAGCGGRGWPDGGGDDAASDVAERDALPPLDAATDGAPDARLDAGADAPGDVATDAARDAAPDAQPDAGAATMLLMAVGVGDMPPAFGTSYGGGRWAALASLGDDEYPAAGGGVTFLPDGRGLATIRSNGDSQAMGATWSGSWSPLAAVAPSVVGFVSAPVATASGALSAQLPGTDAPSVTVTAFDDGTSAWTTGDATSVSGDTRTIPVVALSTGGAPVLLDATPAHTYAWSLRTGATWSAPATIPGVTPATLSVGFVGAIAATRRAGTDDLVAVFMTSSAPGAAELTAETLAAGTWSSPTALASDLLVGGAVKSKPFAVAALRDGRVALAYAAQGNAIKVGFFDGTTWSAFQPVPMAVVSSTFAPVAVESGADATAALELAYIDESAHLRHTRLTDAAGWTWTAPVTIDATRSYGLVSIAVAR